MDTVNWLAHSSPMAQTVGWAAGRRGDGSREGLEEQGNAEGEESGGKAGSTSGSSKDAREKGGHAHQLAQGQGHRRQQCRRPTRRASMTQGSFTLRRKKSKSRPTVVPVCISLPPGGSQAASLAATPPPSGASSHLKAPPFRLSGGKRVRALGEPPPVTPQSPRCR